MQEIQIKLDVFEGPLDLLLHLIQKLEIDIYDIPIAAVTDQYMQYIHAMKEFELGLAGEYLVMAATLMAIKSQTLLPTMELDFELEEDFYEEDPRDALVNQLLEYRKFKYAADQLAEKASERSQYFTKEPMSVETFQTKEQPVLKENQITTIDLFFAFHKMLEKKRQQSPLETTIAAEEVTMAEKMQWLEGEIQGLSPKEGRPLSAFLRHYSKSEIVTTFLALLELMKKQKVMVVQKSNEEPMMLYAVGE
ncbi:segregation/condensation protein A [Enterococcus sp. LJL98]